MECPRCGHIWTYKGDKTRVYITCANCKSAIKINPLPSKPLKQENKKKMTKVRRVGGSWVVTIPIQLVRLYKLRNADILLSIDDNKAILLKKVAMPE